MKKYLSLNFSNLLSGGYKWVLAIVAGAVLALGAVVYRLGGPAYTWYRLTHPEAGQYEHRKSMYEKMPAQPGAIVFWGDSHIAGCAWEEVWAELPVLNRGIAGDHIAGLRARWPEIQRHQPRMVIMSVGINDLFFGHSPHEAAAQYSALLRQMRASSPGTRLILCSLLPVNTSVKWLPMENERIQKLNTALKAISAENGAEFVDLYPHFSDADGRLNAHFTSDGIHLNGTGYAVWTEALKPFFE